METIVTNGAILQCSFGVAPSSLLVLPTTKALCSGMPAATIMDYTPFKNILPFGMCHSIANPTVAAATAAALGVLSPMPCIPCLSAPWTPGNPTILIGGSPALSQDSKLMCPWGGIISINMPG